MTRKFLVAAILFVATMTAYSQVEQPTMLIQALDTTVHETSGLIFHNGKLWTHNDSGCANKIYSIDTITGQVLETKTIEGVTNEDWEDMAKDKSYLYIGNFGGTSTHKQILRIKLEDLDNPDLQVLQPRIINFTYGNPDYPEENYDATNTRFDCEAMIAKDDTIFLFSKNWVDHKTFLYAIPNKANYFHTIVPIDTLQLDYLVTAADYDYVTNTVALIGYTYSTINSRPHITLLRNFSGNDFFGGSVTNQEFSSPSGLTNQETGITYNQIEGVAFRDSSRIWVTNELLNKTVSFITLRIESHLREFVITNPQAVNDPADEPTFPEEPLPIVIDIEHSETTILEGDSVRFYDRSSRNPTSLIWTFEGGEPQTSTESTPVVTYNTKGDYSVSLTAENESSLVNKTYNQLVHVLGYANANFYADTTNICQNDSIVFHNSSENASSIQWTFEGGEPEFSTEENPTVTYHNAGNFYVKLAVQNELSADTVII
ncbi:MAG: PKD domain-containing protein, partial [Bacteroidales bacterium]|nr:PKD domain-containing protein [Bacteroidales bacterium]